MKLTEITKDVEERVGKQVQLLAPYLRTQPPEIDFVISLSYDTNAHFNPNPPARIFLLEGTDYEIAHEVGHWLHYKINPWAYSVLDIFFETTKEVIAICCELFSHTGQDPLQEIGHAAFNLVRIREHYCVPGGNKRFTLEEMELIYEFLNSKIKKTGLIAKI